MRVKSELRIFIYSLICILFLFISSPSWLSLQGVGPCWGVLWLLPWCLSQGKKFGVFGGLCLGLILDAFSVSSVTQVPAFVILGFWWGGLGAEGKPIELIFNLALLAQLGAMIVGFNIWLQYLILDGSFASSAWFHGWSLHTFLSQSILTGLIAPITCGLILLKTSKRKA